jgi:hypothetical protein
MPISTLIASLFAPAVDLIKKFVSKEEDVTKALTELQNVQLKVIETVTKLETEKYELMKTEASSANWITSAWRPIASLAIVCVAILASFGIGHPDNHFWELAQAFLGIYAGSRGVEKIAETVVTKIKK